MNTTEFLINLLRQEVENVSDYELGDPPDYSGYKRCKDVLAKLESGEILVIDRQLRPDLPADRFQALLTLLDTDDAAREAALTYAQEIERRNPELAQDIEARVRKLDLDQPLANSGNRLY